MLTTIVVRSAHQGDSHGGAYLIDLQSGDINQVLDWNRMDIDWEGRGYDRGLRGIAFHDGLTYIAASDELFAFDTDFIVVRSFKNPYLRHCHEICCAGDELLLTSTAFDSVLRFDLVAQRFTHAHLIRWHSPTAGAGTRRLRVGKYDPNKPGGPKAEDTAHVNNVSVREGRTLISGVRLSSLLAVTPSGHESHAPLPEWTHNARAYKDGVLYNSTAEDAVCFATLQGEVIKRFPVPRYDEAELEKTDLPADHARQAFARGLVATDDGLLIAASSPNTITAWDFDSGEQLTTLNFGKDIRNAPHGLEIYPY